MLRVFAYLQQHPVSGIFYYRETIPAHLRPVTWKGTGCAECAAELAESRERRAARRVVQS